jgi:hypothetical protein
VDGERERGREREREDFLRERDKEIVKMSESEREWMVETVAGGEAGRATVVGWGRLC